MLQPIQLERRGDPWDETATRSTQRNLWGSDMKYLRCREEIVQTLTNLFQPMPSHSPAPRRRHASSRAISKSVRVRLTGDGGDDLFLGYPEHRNFWLAQKLAGHKVTDRSNAFLACLSPPYSAGWNRAPRRRLPGLRNIRYRRRH